MLEMKSLLPELVSRVSSLSADLVKRVNEITEIDQGLREAFAQIQAGGRTSQAYETWLADYLDQVSVAWVLGCVFVRFMEDNELIDECYLAGEGEQRTKSDNEYELYFKENPLESDREYLQFVFRQVGEIPVCKDLFARGKTPLWAVGPSGDEAKQLLDFWKEVDLDTGNLKRSFAQDEVDTRFLGDLYQDLSQAAKDKYALLQTPDYVESFILDRTLTPAIETFGLPDLRLIDPTCGSGHFLLGAFDRLFKEWQRTEDNDVVAVQKAFDGVWGVDINPFAVAIARFRLVVAALNACQIKKLKRAPGWKVNLAVGDSLLFGNRWNPDGTVMGEQTFLGAGEECWAPDIYVCEDKDAIASVLGQQYHAVVGNPPYIRSFDPSRNDVYRDRYKSTHGKFTLTIPFFERFFDLCIGGDSGFVGFITSGEFMKADFGKSLTQDFIPKIDLTHVIDSANVPLEGHGTNTIIVFGRGRKPVGDDVRLVRGVKGETPPPKNPHDSLVWKAITENLDSSPYSDQFVSIGDSPRSTFAKHPWNITGGDAAQVRELLEAGSTSNLKSKVAKIGVGFVTGKDKVFELPLSTLTRCGVSPLDTAISQKGEDCRDWIQINNSAVVFPFRQTESLSFQPKIEESTKKFLWAFRTSLWHRKWFKKTQRERGLEWWELAHLSDEKAKTPNTIFWGEISTHNHFGFNRTKKLGDQTAPMIKFKEPFDQQEAFSLLALLNSSVACLWLKQVCRQKGGDHVGSKGARVRKNLWDERYAFASRKVSNLPLPNSLPSHGDKAAQISDHVFASTFVAISKAEVPTKTLLEAARKEFANGIEQLCALQEEIDWECYKLYGLLDNDAVFAEAPPSICPGQRAFEISLAVKVANGDEATSWFSRHEVTPVLELPSDWSDDYKNVVQARLDEISSNHAVGVLESPIYKRRWNLSSWDSIEKEILRDWLLRRIENQVWCNGDEPEIASVSAVADRMSADEEFLNVGELYQGQSDYDVGKLVWELMSETSVPLLPCEIYTTTGLTKFKLWEATWALQRKEDVGEDVEISNPPEFSKKDFQNESCWKLRKEMNVPSEAFTSFPNCLSDSDKSLVVGWAGWDHLQTATAVTSFYDSKKRQGWNAERLIPLLAAIDQLLPWIHQWHSEIDPEYDESAGDSFQGLLNSELQELGLTIEDVRDWTPPKKAKKKTTKKKAAKKKAAKKKSTKKKSAKS